MNATIINKLEKITVEEPSRWLEKANFNVDNRNWLDRSADIAIKVLRTLREKGLSQVDLAGKLNISAQQVNKIVKGRENLTLETISKLESALGISLVVVNCHTSIVKIEKHTSPIALTRRALGTVARKKEIGYSSLREFTPRATNNPMLGA